MTVADQLAHWLGEHPARDDGEIITFCRNLDERLEAPVVTFLQAHPGWLDHQELVALVLQSVPDAPQAAEAAEDDAKVRVYVNSNAKMSRGKMAAHVAHTVLTAAGVHPGLPVVVLGAKPRDIENLSTVIRDAGRTELEPGTLTAGTDWAPERVVDTPVGLPPAANVDTTDMPLPAFLAMAGFIADNPTMMAPAVISQTIRDLMARLEQHKR